MNNDQRRKVYFIIGMENNKKLYLSDEKFASDLRNIRNL